MYCPTDVTYHLLPCVTRPGFADKNVCRLISLYCKSRIPFWMYSVQRDFYISYTIISFLSILKCRSDIPINMIDLGRSSLHVLWPIEGGSCKPGRLKLLKDPVGAACCDMEGISKVCTCNITSSKKQNHSVQPMDRGSRKGCLPGNFLNLRC